MIERRFVTGQVVRALGDDAAPRLQGYAAVFNKPSEDMGFIEIIEPGFFRNVLKDDVRALWNHDSNYPLARSTVRDSLALTEDQVGLFYDAVPTRTSYAQDLIINCRAEIVTQSSFAFEVAEGGQQWSMVDDVYTRRLLPGGCARLYDVSPVTYPAYPDTTSEARSILDDAQKLGLLPVAPSSQGGISAEQERLVRKLARARLQVQINENSRRL